MKLLVRWLRQSAYVTEEGELVYALPGKEDLVEDGVARAWELCGICEILEDPVSEREVAQVEEG